MAMHDDELRMDADTARALIRDQFPQWGAEPVEAVASGGTVNAVYRIGERLAARFPLRAADPAEAEAGLRAEAAALAELAEVCPFPAPRPVAVGRPARGYPLAWSVQTWVPGATATPDGAAGSHAFARDLAALVSALRAAPVRGRRFAGEGRGGHLPDHDAWVATCLDRSEGLLDTEALRALWDRLRSLPRSGPDVMSHRDLIPANLLVRGGRLAGVLDGGAFGPADPALDLVAAWHLLDAGPRATLRAALDVDPVQWRRGAAWACEQALGLVWYYRTTNPPMSALGRSTLARILGDPDL